MGYDLLRYESDDNVGWAIEVFKLNVEVFPEDGNNWDSLGESYLYNGQTELAIKSYQKALDLASSSNCSYCKGSTKALKKLSKMK